VHASQPVTSARIRRRRMVRKPSAPAQHAGLAAGGADLAGARRAKKAATDVRQMLK
jgi:hypothetical protein